MLWAGFPPKSV